MTLDKIKEEYSKKCLQLGDLEYKLICSTLDKEKLIEELKELNMKAAELMKEEKKSEQ